MISFPIDTKTTTTNRREAAIQEELWRGINVNINALWEKEQLDLDGSDRGRCAPLEPAPGQSAHAHYGQNSSNLLAHALCFSVTYLIPTRCEGGS